MPTVSVGRDRLFDALEKTYTQEEFDELCFEFGIELDDVVEEEGEIRYKIEVSANRYDLLCLEGIARSLRIFLGMEADPVYRCADIPSESMIEMHVQPETNLIRPLVVCAVLRGITFNAASYKSFIDLQEKLHQNICRKRTLVAIGTHDLDTLQPPFSYEALPPSDINFVPLKKERSFRADELFKHYKTSTDQSDAKLKKFLHIIEDSPVYPVIYDSNRTVLSLPPIINGAHSAISERTKNVFIECTATDLTKAKIVLNTMITMFSEYCERKYEVEPVKVVYPDARMSEQDPCDGSHSLTFIYPDLSITKFEAPLSDITGGISLTASEVIPLLNKMQLKACVGENSNLIVSVPPTRSDILHSCDLMEDVAIAFGYNNIPKSKPQSMTQGRRQPLNCFSDKIRAEVSRAGYMEVLTWVLISHEENFAMLKRGDHAAKAVTIANPRSSEFQEVRTSLMSGLLNALKHNIDHPRPIKIFEVGDVVTLDEARDVGASNNRRLAALYCNVSSGFEEIAGLVHRIMKVVPKFKVSDYMKPSDEPSLFPKRRCDILLKGQKIGIFGIVHPELMYRQVISGAKCPELFMGSPYRAGDQPYPGSGTLENAPHNTMHSWVGDPTQGPHRQDMGAFYSAARDPLFYAHHSNIDRLWNVWKKQGGRRRDFDDRDFLEASFLFYDENKRLVRIKVEDCLVSENLRYNFQDVENIWLGTPPTPSTTNRRSLLKLNKTNTNAIKFPVNLDSSPITTLIKRPKMSRSKGEKDEEEEVLVVDNIEFDGDAYIKFDVYINTIEYEQIGPESSEFAGSFVHLPHKHSSKMNMKVMKSKLNLGINDLLDDIEAEDDESLLVTLVPRRGKVKIGGLKIEFL